MNLRKGFTLIEILIVVAIIAILASVILVGLGPTQQAGRDARRLSDITEVQNGLELYYSKFGGYPGDANGANGGPESYSSMGAALTGAGIGVSQFPNDPSSGGTYYYGNNGTSGSLGSSYILAAKLENASNTAFTNYKGPTYNSGWFASGDNPGSCTPSIYCVSL